MTSIAPDGSPRLIPRIFTDDPVGLVAFIRTAFEAIGEVEPGRPTKLRWGDSVLMVADTGTRQAQTASLYLYDPDVDAAYRRAVECGATSVEVPEDQFYGERRAMVQDPWGNTWQVAKSRS
jgi:PhnB protein